ncbi:MAG: hypothetical protein ACYSU3_22685 [Planctomycetota bacterium]|jgi:hypothetical protein
MKTKRTMIFLMAICLVVLLCSFCERSHAADVDIKKSKDVNLKVWNTFLGIKIGDPIYDGDVPAGDRVQVNGSWWATDVAVKQRFIRDVVANTADHSIGAVVAAGPGVFEMQEMQTWLTANVGTRRVELTDIKSGDADIHVAVDLVQWIAGGEPVNPVGAVIPIMHGTSPLLPGYQVSLAGVVFDPAQGWVNTAPYSGEVTVVGDIGLTAAPDHGTLIPSPPISLALVRIHFWEWLSWKGVIRTGRIPSYAGWLIPTFPLRPQQLRYRLN